MSRKVAKVVSNEPNESDGSRFKKLAVHTTDSPLVLLKDFEDPLPEDNGNRIALGPLFEPQVLGDDDKQIPIDYLLTSKFPPLFRPGFTGAENWSTGKDLLCFPSSSAEIDQWLNLWSEKLAKKWEILGIRGLIRVSTSCLEINPCVCAALVAFWNPIVNCFYLPEGPMSITLEDIASLTNCSVDGIQLRFHNIKKDQFAFQSKTITSVIAEHLEKGSDKWGGKEEFEFYLEWLSKFIFCSRGKRSSKFMTGLCNFLCSINQPIRFAPFLLNLLYKSLYDAIPAQNSAQKDFPARPIGGPLWLLFLWAHLYFPSLTYPLTVDDRAPFPFYGMLISKCCRAKNWSKLTLSGCLRELLCEREPGRRRKWRPYPSNHPIKRRRLDVKESSYWDSVLTPRDLVAVDKNGFSFEVYNPHLCARQLGFAQGAALPFFQSFNRPLSQRVVVPFDKRTEMQALLPGLKSISFLSSVARAGVSDSFACCWAIVFPALLEKNTNFLDGLEEDDEFLPERALERLRTRAPKKRLIEGSSSQGKFYLKSLA